MAKPSENGTSGRDESGKFVKGNKLGKSCGRPKAFHAFQERCQEFATEQGWAELVELATSKGKSALGALELIFAYAYGRPKQIVSGEDGAPIPIALILPNDGLRLNVGTD